MSHTIEYASPAPTCIHCHHKRPSSHSPFLEVLEMLGADRVLFSVAYPYEQMDLGASWFDDLRFPSDVKLRVGRLNADLLFHLGLPKANNTSAEAFAS